MGCCYSTDDDASSQVDASERTNLLRNPVGDTQARTVNSLDYGSHLRGTVSEKGDEQSALNRILHQTANNVIDVSAMDSHNLEQHEYLDRARQYNQKISSAKCRHKTLKTSLLSDVPGPEKILSSDPIHPNDLILVSDLAEKCNEALKLVKVEHKEDLVVQFGIP